MIRICTLLLALLMLGSPALAAVELALRGNAPVKIDDVYLRDGSAFIALDDALPALKMSGYWDSVQHIYRFRTPQGTAMVSPGSNYLRLNGNFFPLAQQPRFIDSKLRVDETFLTEVLPNALNLPVYYRNLDPAASGGDTPESSLDRLFAFLLQKKGLHGEQSGLGGIIIDPGHGGQDPGSIGVDGVKEKDLNLDVAKRLQKLCKMKLGKDVFLTRDRDYALSLKERWETIRKFEGDVLLSLHAQASSGPIPHGVTLFIRPHDETEGQVIPAEESDSLRLAEHLRQAFLDAGLPVVGIVRAPLLPLGRGNLPAVDVEMGYLSNSEDCSRLASAEGQDLVANILFTGLKSYADEKKEKL